ncbi:hypothetical protein [Sinimarinibacterium sp. NLF-5-8]|uniref:hypothetical protein n=1 Tax=Sinimarinibacterium sp. NLF-5-8 TaxID=2698684 RepID=UPI00137C0C2F|nr:hypothetical protein [Sinimarinibacterium sp. NLF-5-8]QHS11193.1 hypothetical protein GT972_14275 [Sinimarinibacterium sp. NLF-5-8]
MEKFILSMSLILFTACQSQVVEKNFFSGNISSRIERLEKYPLDKQWIIFKYGNQIIHPPATDLALPIARRGKPAMNYIISQLSESDNDLDFRDSLVVFRVMRAGGYYDICNNDAAMKSIRENQWKIVNDDWQSVYAEMLIRLCH